MDGLVRDLFPRKLIFIQALVFWVQMKNALDRCKFIPAGFSLRSGYKETEYRYAFAGPLEKGLPQIRESRDGLRASFQVIIPGSPDKN